MIRVTPKVLTALHGERKRTAESCAEARILFQRIRNHLLHQLRILAVLQVVLIVGSEVDGNGVVLRARNKNNETSRGPSLC
mmetsp:Transcript_12062/g.22461  ORF Transcript_12062/g.22461 Transcript_12062/m.22461 type:complete len:81 (-) Transcript_12062:35-277(-)